ncbi:glycosyltransferase, partial [Candidatus Gottesmanbacteria bacterium]|nr:glycosyltransferase [Candidatus Gottesmanbacteria bacterium]
MKKAVIVLPTYNEKENIEDIITLILAQQRKIADWELFVLVSDSSSPDGTGEEVRRLKRTNHHLELLNVKERGIGVGLVKGYQFAFTKMAAEVVIQMDADLQHDPKEIVNFLIQIDKGYNFIQGSRFIKGGKNDLEWYRRFFSWSANWVSRLLLGAYKVHEFTTSYRAFTKDLFSKVNLEEIPWRGNSFVFQPAFLYGVFKADAKIKEIPIVFVDRTRGLSKMQIFNYIKDLLLFCVKARLRDSKTIIKFAAVGTIGFIVNTIGLELFVNLGLHPAISAALGGEVAIISNFLLNNFWTFKHRKIETKNLVPKFFQF